MTSQMIPYERTSIEVFIPDSLKDLDPKPHFRIRPLTSRERRQITMMVSLSEAKSFSIEEIRDETIKGIKQLYDEAEAAEKIGTLTEYWETGEQYRQAAQSDPDVEFPISEEEEIVALKIVADVTKEHRPLKKMGISNRDHLYVSSMAEVAVSIVSFSNIDMELKESDKEDGFFTIAFVERMLPKLFDLAAKVGLRGDDKVQVWSELRNYCAGRLVINKDTVKNSDAPAPSDSAEADQQKSQKASSSASTASGKSKAASKKTRTKKTSS